MLALIKDGGRANYELNTCIIPIGQMGKLRPTRSHNLPVTTQLERTELGVEPKS